jgi:Cyclic nucleotide-binding domain
MPSPSSRTPKRLADSTRALSATVHNPSLLRAQLAFGAAWTAEWAFTVALGVLAFRDGGVEAVGIVAFLRFVPSAFLAPFGTTLADRFRRDRMLAWYSFLRAAATAGAAAILLEGGPNLVVYGLAVIATAAFTTFRPTHSALLPALCTTPVELTSAHIVRGLLVSLSTLLGPLTAALLLDLGSPAGVFATAGALSLASGLLLLGMSYEAPHRGPSQPLGLIVRETLDGFRALARYRDAGVLMGLALAASLTRGFLNVFVVVVALDLLATGDSGVGILTGAVGAGAVVGSLAAFVFVSGRSLAALEAIGLVLWGLPLTLSGTFPLEPVIVALMCAIGFGNTLVDIGLYTLPARLVPEELHARIFGAKESLTALTVAVGAFVTPFCIDLLGIRAALILLGLVAPVLAALAWRRLRAIDGAIAHRDREVEVLNSVSMFRPMPMPAIDELALHLERVDVAAGEDVVVQGEHGDRFYVIEHGEADVIGDGRYLRTLRSGDGFGEIALLHDMLRTATVRARTPLRLYTLDRRHFLPAVSDYESSEREADALVLDRLGTFDPRSESIG